MAGLVLHGRMVGGGCRLAAGRVQGDEEAGPAGRAGEHAAVRVRVEEREQAAAGGATDDSVAVRAARRRPGKHAKRLAGLAGRREGERGVGGQLELEEAEAAK